MRSLVNTLLCLFILFHAASCIKKVTVKLPPFDQRLVVHGYIAAGELFKVTVGQTVRDHTFGKGTYLSNAFVLLYENGMLKDTLRYDSAEKNYASTKVIAETGKPYTIKVEAAGFPSVEATATGPSVPVLQSLKHIRNARQNNKGFMMDDVEFTFQDPAGEKNYYMVGLYPSNRTYTFGCVYSIDPVIEREKSSLLPLDETDCLKPESIFFTDKSFDGQLKMMSLNAWTHSFDVSQAPGPKYRAYLKRYAIDEAGYTYFKFTSTYHSGDDLPFVTENVEKKGNITNGYGIFTIFDVRIDSIR